MTLFGSIDRANNAPKYSVDADGNSGTDQYGNTVYAVDATEIGVTAGVAHTGWIHRRVGTGPLSDIAITSGGTSYDNTDTIAVTSTQGVNAAATLVTDGSGIISTVTITNNGNGFIGSEAVTITTSTGSGANLTPSFGGRSGRVTNEVLVASKISGDGSDDAIFPDS